MYTTWILSIIWWGFFQQSLIKPEDKPKEILTREDFDKFTSGGEKPFKWAPGLVGDDMNHEEFSDTLKAAAATEAENG